MNVGQDRWGIAPEDALALADRIQELDRLRLVGLQGYEGNVQHVRDPGERQRLCDGSIQRLAAAFNDLRAAGHTLDVVTAGGTGTAEFCAPHDAVTEVQPGSFMFMDADYLDTTGVPYQPALAAIATVISQPTQDRAVIDAGLKTLPNDSDPPRLADTPGWSYDHAGDEHGTLTPTGKPEPHELG